MDAVVFDLFGTLVPNLSVEGFEASVADLAALLGVPSADVDRHLRSQFGLRMDGTIPDGPRQFDGLVEALGIAPAEATLQEAVALWGGFLSTGIVPKPEAVETLDAIVERGVALALATDCSTSTSERLDATPLGRYFEVRACSALLGVTKPHARMYEHVIDGLGVDPTRCLYVGDGNSEELPGAKRHGMTTVWVDNGANQHWRARFVPEGDHTVRDLREVVPILDALR